MKKTQSPSLHQSSQRKQHANLQDSRHSPKTHSALKTFKSAFKKCAEVFALILTGKRKTATKAIIGSDDRKITSKVRGVVSCKSVI